MMIVEIKPTASAMWIRDSVTKLIGEALAILTALCWATSPVIYRKALVGVDLLVANLMRAVPATVLLVLFYFGSGGLQTVLTIDSPSLILIGVSVISGRCLETFSFSVAL